MSASTTTSKSDDAKKSDQASAVSRGVPIHVPINIRMVQNVLLIWLDSNIEENNEDCCNTISQLRRIVNTINIFTDGDQCVKFIDDIQNEKVCMIISGALGEHMVPRIHDKLQVNSIFIFCGNKDRHEQWTKEWVKIKGVFTEISIICQAIQKAADQCEHNAMPISFMATSDDISNKQLNQLDCSFMYTQIMKEILLNIKFEEHHIKEFIQYCRDAFVENKDKLGAVKQFEREYHKKTPVRWYTGTGFIYPMLNHALRVMNIDVIIKMSFFIGDLHRQMEQLHEEQYIKGHKHEVLTLYRGQGLSKTDFEKISKMKGGLMSFNNFLSTTGSRNISIDFARNTLLDSDLVGILFMMKIDPSQSTTPFASIKDVSAFSHEDEILFSMHSIFRIDDITPMVEDPRLFQVDLTLTSDDDKDLRVLSERIRHEIHPESTPWDRLGKLLLLLGQNDKAQHLYEVVLHQATDELEKAHHYYHIGVAKSNKGEFKMALAFNEKALKIWQHSFPPDHLRLASVYHTIGTVYYSMGEYSKALSYFEKCLKIEEQLLPPNDPRLANSYNSVGTVYNSMGEYSKVLSYYEKCLKIQQQSLPPNHPRLATSYNNIGAVYRSMGEYLKAFSYYEKVLEIQQQSLPPNHPDLAASYINSGKVYHNIGEYSKALSYYEKALEIQQQSLPSNHPNLGVSYYSIACAYDSMGEYLKAHSSFEKALEIQQQSLPQNHPDLAHSYNRIGTVYDRRGEHSEALSYYEKALEIRQHSLPSNHPDLADSYKNIGALYLTIGVYSKALLYSKKALEVQKQSLPPNHPDLAHSYNRIGTVCESRGEHSEALSYYERALEIRQQSLSPNHLDLATFNSNIGSAYAGMGQYSKAVSYYERALEIWQQSLPPNHPHLAGFYNNVGVVYCNMNKYSKACSFLEQAVNIVQQSLPSNHPLLESYRNNLAAVKKKL